MRAKAAEEGDRGAAGNAARERDSEETWALFEQLMEGRARGGATAAPGGGVRAAPREADVAAGSASPSVPAGSAVRGRVRRPRPWRAALGGAAAALLGVAAALALLVGDRAPSRVAVAMEEPAAPTEPPAAAGSPLAETGSVAPEPDAEGGGAADPGGSGRLNVPDDPEPLLSPAGPSVEDAPAPAQAGAPRFGGEPLSGPFGGGLAWASAETGSEPAEAEVAAAELAVEAFGGMEEPGMWLRLPEAKGADGMAWAWTPRGSRRATADDLNRRTSRRLRENPGILWRRGLVRPSGEEIGFERDAAVGPDGLFSSLRGGSTSGGRPTPRAYGPEAMSGGGGGAPAGGGFAGGAPDRSGTSVGGSGGVGWGGGAAGGRASGSSAATPGGRSAAGDRGLGRSEAGGRGRGGRESRGRGRSEDRGRNGG